MGFLSSDEIYVDVSPCHVYFTYRGPLGEQLIQKGLHSHCLASQGNGWNSNFQSWLLLGTDCHGLSDFQFVLLCIFLHILVLGLRGDSDGSQKEYIAR